MVATLEEGEGIFRNEIGKSKLVIRNVPADKISFLTLESPKAKSLWDNIVMASGTQKLCLENVIKLYLKVRSFSYTKDYFAKYKIKEQQVKKALRKDMKQSSNEK